MAEQEKRAENEQQHNIVVSPFDAIRHIDGQENEYWSARELYKLLGYSTWQKFQYAIEQAKKSCEQSEQAVSDHFNLQVKMVTIGSKAQRKMDDYHLSRYACYLCIQNADPIGKPVVALAQTYFAVQTRRQELTDQIAALPEDQQRLIYRSEMAILNQKLNESAQYAGVISPRDFATFTDHGYRGLYGGLAENTIHARKRLEEDEHILDHMGSEELIDNLFRAKQAETKLKRDNIQGKNAANSTHFTVGRKVREFIINELGGTPPEDLPTPEKSIKQLQHDEHFQVKYKDQLNLFETRSEEQE
ncbi:MAG: DNA damage-inducible protein D [Ktedonobacteraceae bacterium]